MGVSGRHSPQAVPIDLAGAFHLGIHRPGIDKCLVVLRPGNAEDRIDFVLAHLADLEILNAQCVSFGYRGPRVVEELAVFLRHIQIGLFDAGPRFLEELGLQRLALFHHGVGEGIFGLDVGNGLPLAWPC